MKQPRKRNQKMQRTTEVGIYLTSSGNYDAQLSMGRGNTIHIGRYETIEEAAEARKEAIAHYKPHTQIETKPKRILNEQFIGTPWYGL